MSRPLAPHEIAAPKIRRQRPPGFGQGVVAGLGCLGWIGASALVAWIAWSFTRLHAAFLAEEHIWWIIGASAALVLGLSSIWGGISTGLRSLLGGTTPATIETDGKQVGHLVDGSPHEPAGQPAPRAPRGGSGGGSVGCALFFGLILGSASLVVLVAPLLPREHLLRLSIIGDGVATMRADRVSDYIDEKDYESARRLGSLGLAEKTVVTALPQLARELELVEILLMSGADPDSRNGWGDTLLMEASDPLLVERLLAHGATPGIANDEGKTVTEEALARWDFGVAVKFADTEGAGAPLAEAIRRGDREELSRLLDGGLDPDSIVLLRSEYDYELSPLYYAATFGDEKAVDVLLAAGASQDIGLVPPLVGAVESRSIEIATRLVEAGAIVDYHGRSVTDALYRAIEFDSMEMVEHLISLGAGKSPAYFNLLTDSNNLRIHEMIEAVIVDPAMEPLEE